MMKKALLITSVFLLLVGLFPYGLYWWGIANVNGYPEPSSTRLDEARKQEVWERYGGHGQPRIKGVSPYGYLISMYCQVNHGINSEYCFEKYPGLIHAGFATKMHIMKNAKEKRALDWHLSSISYTIWASNNWSIDEILSELDATSNEK